MIKTINKTLRSIHFPVTGTVIIAMTFLWPQLLFAEWIFNPYSEDYKNSWSFRDNQELLKSWEDSFIKTLPPGVVLNCKYNDGDGIWRLIYIGKEDAYVGHTHMGFQRAISENNIKIYPDKYKLIINDKYWFEIDKNLRKFQDKFVMAGRLATATGICKPREDVKLKGVAKQSDSTSLENGGGKPGAESTIPSLATTQRGTADAASSPKNRPGSTRAGSVKTSSAKGQLTLKERVTMACADGGACCQWWYGTGEDRNKDLGMIKQCGNVVFLYENLDFWCNATGYVPDFCKGKPPAPWENSEIWEGGVTSGKCFPPTWVEEIPSHAGAGTLGKLFLIWDPVVGASGTPIPEVRMGLDEMVAGTRGYCFNQGGKKCYYAGGCINAMGAIAVTEDRSWAVVACSSPGGKIERSEEADNAAVERAIAAAKSQCETRSGCSCFATDIRHHENHSWTLPIRTDRSNGNCTSDRTTCAICSKYLACLEKGGHSTPNGINMDLRQVRNFCKRQNPKDCFGIN